MGSGLGNKSSHGGHGYMLHDQDLWLSFARLRRTYVRAERSAKAKRIQKSKRTIARREEDSKKVLKKARVIRRGEKDRDKVKGRRERAAIPGAILLEFK